MLENSLLAESKPYIHICYPCSILEVHNKVYGFFYFSISIDYIQSITSPQELLFHCYVDYFESPRILRVEPDISVSVHGLVPGSCPHFQNPENLSGGQHKCVIVTRGSATISCTLYFHATGKWPISHALPLRGILPSCRKQGKVGPSSNLVPVQLSVLHPFSYDSLCDVWSFSEGFCKYSCMI